MSNIKNGLFYSIIAIVIMSITGCAGFKTYTSDILIEEAEVIQLVYIPDTSTIESAPGIGFNGNITFTIISTGHKEIWAVVFKCKKHNKTFSLQGKQIYEKVKIGQIVDLKYKELYTIKDNEKIIYDYKTVEVVVQ